VNNHEDESDRADETKADTDRNVTAAVFALANSRWHSSFVSVNSEISSSLASATTPLIIAVTLGAKLLMRSSCSIRI
jgi:hypothetical protein